MTVARATLLCFAVVISITNRLLAADLGCAIPVPHLWPRVANVVKVPYVMVGLDTNETAQVLKAVLEWEDTGVVDFVLIAPPARHDCAYLEIRQFFPPPRQDDCVCEANTRAGYLGKGQGTHRVAIAGCFPKQTGCINKPLPPAQQTAWGGIAHELGHVLGLNHEHQRYDRDGFVKLEPPPKGHTVVAGSGAFTNFINRTCFEEQRLYNYLSIMHYPLVINAYPVQNWWKPPLPEQVARSLRVFSVRSDFKTQHPSAQESDIGDRVIHGVTSHDGAAVSLLYRIGNVTIAKESDLCQ